MKVHDKDDQPYELQNDRLIEIQTNDMQEGHLLYVLRDAVKQALQDGSLVRTYCAACNDDWSNEHTYAVRDDLGRLSIGCREFTEHNRQRILDWLSREPQVHVTAIQKEHSNEL